VLAVGVSDFGNYAARVADLEGVRRAVMATVAFRQTNIATENIEGALVRRELRNPYDDQPFAWEGDRRSIVFRGMASGERGEHRIQYRERATPVRAGFSTL
jgi:hypothetical protein